MYENEIKELNNEIRQNEKKIAKVSADTKIKYKFITFLMGISAILGIGLGGIVGHPLAFAAVCLSLSTIASVQIYDKGIKPNKDKIDSAKLLIEKCSTDIKRYEKEQAKVLNNEIDQVDKRSSKYTYSPEQNKASEEFNKYVDSIREEGFFEGFDNESRKR